MTRDLKGLSLLLLAVFVLGALTAQGASAHEFHSEFGATITTGTDTNDHEFAIGTAGVVKCTFVETESTQVGTQVVGNTYKTDTITVSPTYSFCSFGGKGATINFEHCAYVFDSDTTSGNTTGGEHANLEIECAEKSSIKIATSVCTLTIGPQTIAHAVRYENDPISTTAFNIIATAHNIVVGNLNDKAGCVLVPKGAVGKYIGNTTLRCYEDEGSASSGTGKTTPVFEFTKEGFSSACGISF